MACMTDHSRRFARLAAIVALVAFGSACAMRSHTLTVSAAASLTDAFTDIADAFEVAHPGHTVELNLAASGVLAQQIRQGAAVDVFASASGVVMDDLEAGGFLTADPRQDIAANRMVLITPLSGPTLSDPQDLSGVSQIAIGNPDLVPAGMYAQESLEMLNLWDELEGRFVYGESVRQVLAWVETGEVSAGVVFATDAQSSQRVRVVAEFPPESHDTIRYPIAVVKGSHVPELASEFVAFVVSDEGQAILARHGFRSLQEAAP
jgi:molybdate transport system substrate-binding protein